MREFNFGTMAVAAMCVAVTLTTGCTSSVSGGLNQTIASNAASTMTQTLVTDGPGDQILALGLTVDSIVLTDAKGASTTVLSTPTPVEVSHLDAVAEPLLPPMKIPQDTYVSATIVVANPVVVYVDPTTKKPVTAGAVLSAASTTVTFNSPIVVGANAAPVVFDILVGPSVAISGTTVTVTPTFDVRQIPLNAQPTNGNNGKVNGVIGAVVSVSGSSLVIADPKGTQLTLATDSNTVFQGFNALSDLTAGQIVDADVAQQSNGSLLATRIHLCAAKGQNLLLGPVTAETGTPVTSFSQLVRQPMGPGSTATGTTYTVSTTSSTTFGLAPQMGTLPTLPFTAAFNASTMFAGQNVAVATASLTGTTAVAASVTLAPQTVGGTVSAVASSGGFTTYTVMLPTGSALGSLTGVSSVVVYVNNAAQMTNSTPIAVGSTVRFNGLLFKDAGTLRMLAGMACDAAGNAPPQHH